MQKLARLEANVKEWVDLEARAADLAEMQALVDENPDPEMLTELDSEVRDLARVLERMRLNVMMSGPHDDADAILAIHAGGGRHRIAGLGSDAVAYVFALGRAARVSDRCHRGDRGR